ncbi:cell division protein FtsQ/DivIB [Ligilactobacillus sp. LYQ139]|uniref:cell division protein FtsQ/DivIB n=1 Tax=Ligilactobacillus sp. LYQ139 TaxID=3378800 RepID=UPI003854223A
MASIFHRPHQEALTPWERAERRKKRAEKHHTKLGNVTDKPQKLPVAAKLKNEKGALRWLQEKTVTKHSLRQQKRHSDEKTEKLTPKAQQLLRDTSEQVPLKEEAGKRLPETTVQGPRKEPWRLSRVRRRALVLVIGFSFAVMVTVISVLPISRISSVRVTGTDNATGQAIVQASQLQPRQSLIMVYPRMVAVDRQIKQKVNSVRSVTVQIVGRQVVLRVREYPIVGYQRKAGQYYKVLASGAVGQTKIQRINGNYPIFYGFKPRELRAMAAQVNRLPIKVRQAISEIHAQPNRIDPQRVHLYMNSGNEVIARVDTFAAKMKYYPVIAAKMKANGVVDFEVGAYSYPFSDKNK